jgi:hypothetical protein
MARVKTAIPKSPEIKSRFPDRDVCAEFERQGFVIVDLNDGAAWAKLTAHYRAIDGDWPRGEKLPRIKMESRKPA